MEYKICHFCKRAVTSNDGLRGNIKTYDRIENDVPLEETVHEDCYDINVIKVHSNKNRYRSE